MKQTAPTNMLKFAKGNAKLGKDVLIFSLSAGHSCPGAKDCKSSVFQNADGSRRIEDGPDSMFRCYAASAEIRLPNVYKLRRHNYDTLLGLRETSKMVSMLLDSMHKTGMKGVTKVRVHESGDYFSFSYFKAWMEVATAFPNVKFYSYTKSLPHVINGIKQGIVPPNFIFTASKGGHFDHLIEPNGFKSVTVTTTEAETEAAKANGGKFDHDDSLALGDADFFLQVHGQQPAGTAAAKYWDKLTKAGRGGYSKKNGKRHANGIVVKLKPARIAKVNAVKKAA
jgi:hypothetical protein